MSTASTIHDPIIVSVPHCGTRFLKARLGIKDHLHTTSELGSLIERVKDRIIIVPMRKPATVWRSWCRRHDPRNIPYGEFFCAWGNLQALAIARPDLDVICVDKCRDLRITDWTPVGDDDASRAGWNLLKIDLRCLHKLPIVTAHYGPHVRAL